MTLAPLCKTAIVSYLVDKETVPKLWNLSSNMRKRLQMIMEQMEIIVREYNEKVLKLNGWMRAGRFGVIFQSTDHIKKGIANYVLKTQEHADTVTALNGKLRYFDSRFEPEIPFEIDFVEELKINYGTFDFYSRCSFNKVGKLSLFDISLTQMKSILSKIKSIKELTIKPSFIASLDLRLAKTKSIKFTSVNFKGEVKLPYCLKYLCISDCKNLHLLKVNRVTEIEIKQGNCQDSFDFLRRLKGVKEVHIKADFSKLIDYLPSTVRMLGSEVEFASVSINFLALSKKFPFLIRIDRQIPIETAQKLNLRSISPIMSATGEEFTLRPREIEVCDNNVEQLNNHPELFERVEKVRIYTNIFNYDCLPAGMKEICFSEFQIQGEKLESLEKNNWKFEESVLDVVRMDDCQTKKILDSLEKVKKVKINAFRSVDIEEYPQFRFVT